MEYRPLSELHQEWAKSVRHKMIDYNLTSVDLARLAGKSPELVSHVLNDTRRSQPTVQAIDDVLMRLEGEHNGSPTT